MPNLFIMYILFIGLFYSKIAGLTYGIIFGLLLDFFISKKIKLSLAKIAQSIDVSPLTPFFD